LEEINSQRLNRTWIFYRKSTIERIIVRIRLNTLNFSGIPSGSRGANGIFSGIGNHTIWWNASENGPEHAGYFGLNNSSNSLSGGTYNKGRGLSLRCIRN
jgi:uncharacterized protein (TIGR02145 family)